MLNDYRHIIWDWNGTLLNDLSLCVSALNSMLRARGREPVTEDSYLREFGFPVRAYYTRLGVADDDAKFVSAVDDFMKSYWESLHTAELHAGVRETLATLQERGYSQSILSAYPQAHLEQIVDERNLRRHFSALVGHQDTHAHGKIDNGIRKMRELGLEPSRVVMIGDTVHDAEVAHAMGVACVLVAHGHNHRCQLEKAGVRIISSLAELEGASGSMMSGNGVTNSREGGEQA